MSRESVFNLVDVEVNMEIKMTELKIEGMTCGHCVRSVTKALTDIPGVISAGVDLTTGIAKIEHDDSVDDSRLIGAIQEAGYAATS